MSLALYDRVRETTGVLGTSDAVLLGAVIGYQSFAVVGNTNTCYYTIADSAGNWEVGLGTYSTTGPTLARTTVYASSNANAKVSFPAGTKDIFLTYPAEKAVQLDTASAIATGSMLYGNGTTSYSSLALGTNGYILQSNGTAPTWVAASTIIGGAGGSNTQVQYNNSGALAGSANMTFNGTSLTLANVLNAPSVNGATTLTLATGGTTAATITSGQLVLIGTGTASGTNKLQVNSDALVNGLTVGLGGGASQFNTVVGKGAFVVNSTGIGNAAFGFNTLANNTANDNNAFGYATMLANTTGTGNAAFGGGVAGVSGSSLSSNTSGSYNTALGGSSLVYNVSGANNTAAGYGSLLNNTANNNTAVGYQAGYSNTTGDNLTAVGYKAAYTSSTNINVTAIGANALQNNTGDFNTAVGQSSLYLNTSGVSNSAVGYAALKQNTTGSYNTALGQETLNQNNASNNTAVGYQAGYSGTTATNNVCLGYKAGYTNSIGYQNTYVGMQAGLNSTGNNCVFVGQGAGQSTTSDNNTFLGTGAGYQVTSGANNTVVGMYNGNNGGLDIRTASNYIVLSDGAGNPRGIYDASGNYYVGCTTVPGNGSTVTGTYMGATGSIIASRSAGSGLGSAMYVTIMGGSSDLAQFYASSTFVGGITTNGTTTSFNTSSDYRLKEDVQPMQDALATVAQLNPVTYKWIKDGSDGQGFIAHELQAVVPDCVSGEKDAVDAEGKPIYQGIDTSFLVATLTKAIQEQQALIESLTTRIAALEAK